MCPALRPFNKAQAGLVKQFGKTRQLKLPRIVDAIKVKMIEGAIAKLIRLKQCIGGALHSTFDTPGSQKIPREGGFANAKIAAQVHRCRRPELASQAGSKIGCCLLIHKHDRFFFDEPHWANFLRA